MSEWRWLRFAVNSKFHWAIGEGRYTNLYRKACDGKLVRSLNPMEWTHADPQALPPSFCVTCELTRMPAERAAGDGE